MRYVFLSPPSNLESLDIRGARRIFNDGRHCWSTLTYLNLKKYGFKCDLRDEPEIDAVNIAHGRYWRELPIERNCFRVSCDADWPILKWANYTILQNPVDANRRSTCWLPLWPQSGLIERKSPENILDSGNIGNRVGYFGRVDNALLFRKFADLCQQHGLEFIAKGPDVWNDFSDVDFAISLRFLSSRRIRKKPASKLVNAWLAGVPFIAMSEPAFVAIGDAMSDWIECKTAEDVITSVIRLREDTNLYNALVRNGREKSRNFTEAATAQKWISVLQGPIVDCYDKWKSRQVNLASLRRSAHEYSFRIMQYVSARFRLVKNSFTSRRNPD
jgi:hypothetical protein